jgi:hypothetical protein
VAFIPVSAKRLVGRLEAARNVSKCDVRPTEQLVNDGKCPTDLAAIEKCRDGSTTNPWLGSS